MTESEAVELIERADFGTNNPQKWADLGCGSGLFSNALGSLLPEKSRILAVDKTEQDLPTSQNGVQIEFLQADFIKGSIPLDSFDGVLMANSLHYVKNQKGFIRSLRSQLADNGQFIIIEYDTERGNPWVPHPVSFTKLNDLFTAAGYSHIRKIGERSSKYGYKKIYACEIKP